MVAPTACATFVEPPVLPGTPPTVDVTSRFSPDYVHLYGGTITFQTLQGTYNGSCKNPSASGNYASGTEWYAPIGGYASVPNDWSGAAMTGKLLDLVKNASASCALTVQALSYTCASCGGTSYTLQPSSTVALATTYAGSAATFTPPALSGGQNQDGDPFYANFYISAVAPWTSNPTIYALVSNDPSLATSGSSTASYTAFNGSTSTTFVAPPDYSVSTGSTTAAVTIAANGTAATVSGGVSLAYGSTPASSAAGCVYTTTAPTQTNAGIATAFAAGTACPTSGGGQSWATPFHTMFINASNFVSVGNTVPKTGYIIFQNSSSGVSSYELVSYTFTSTCSAGEVSKTDSSGLGAANACCASASTTLNCDGTCANTQTDPNNCGSCANVCPASAPNCVSGSCVFETDTTTNVLSNGTFASGFSPWTLQVQNGAAATQTQDTTTYESSTQSEKITVTTANLASNVELLQTGVSLTAGQLVTVSLWGKASSSFSVPCVLQKGSSPYTSYTSQNLALTTTWTPFTISYVQTVTDPSAYFDIQVGASTGTYWFDDIWLTAVAAQNLVENGSFESGLNPWSFGVQGGAAATETIDNTTSEDGVQSVKVNVTTSSSTLWDVQLYQDGLYIPSGTTATFSFWAKASTSMAVQFGAQESASPYTSWQLQSFTLTTSWANYSFTYASSNSVSTAFIANLAGTTGTVWLDDVAVWNPQ